jgi:hypothetical protein
MFLGLCVILFGAVLFLPGKRHTASAEQLGNFGITAGIGVAICFLGNICKRGKQ